MSDPASRGIRVVVFEKEFGGSGDVVLDEKLTRFVEHPVEEFVDALELSEVGADVVFNSERIFAGGIGGIADAVVAAEGVVGFEVVVDEIDAEIAVPKEIEGALHEGSIGESHSTDVLEI